MQKAKLHQVFSLAWISAQAFTHRRRNASKWTALLAYPAHLITVAVATINGVLFQNSSQAMVVISNLRRTPLKGAVIVGLVAAALFILAIPMATGGTGPMALLLFALLVVLVLALCASIFSIRPHHGRGVSPAALRKAMDKEANGRPAYTFELLARSPNAEPGAGAKLLTEALDELAGQGSVVGCIAANVDLIPFYNRFGLQQIEQTQMMLNPAWDTTGREVKN